MEYKSYNFFILGVLPDRHPMCLIREKDLNLEGLETQPGLVAPSCSEQMFSATTGERQEKDSWVELGLAKPQRLPAEGFLQDGPSLFSSLSGRTLRIENYGVCSPKNPKLPS